MATENKSIHWGVWAGIGTVILVIVIAMVIHQRNKKKKAAAAAASPALVPTSTAGGQPSYIPGYANNQPIAPNVGNNIAGQVTTGMPGAYTGNTNAVPGTISTGLPGALPGVVAQLNNGTQAGLNAHGLSIVSQINPVTGSTVITGVPAYSPAVQNQAPGTTVTGAR